ncbi:serine protease [Clostridium perfringens]|uniref:S1 family peptidase n=1 Tax=Clostridium perfringens TaxID=1502 RepID=UPI001A2913DA|nr:serine protease [Clostridium perfringens]MCX0370220.1 serine protease [Clostridium perfringens]HAT4245994.1 trypsin-like peptidase domain-containing protein [Clostridium perfringens]
MNINDLSTQLLYTTVPIFGVKSDGSQVAGTGFIFSIFDKDDKSKSIPLLITNYHVMDGIIEGFIEFSLAENNMPIKGKSIRVTFDGSVLKNKLGSLDLIAIPLAEALNDLMNKKINVFYRTISKEMIPNREQMDDLAALEKVTFIGYPSGLYDTYNKTSIIRQGITATPIWNDFKGEPIFLIDAGVFPGSSGSPVFIYNQGSYATRDGITIGNRVLFVGIISETILSNGVTYLNLGRAINSLSMYEELEKLIEPYL